MDELLPAQIEGGRRSAMDLILLIEYVEIRNREKALIGFGREIV